MTPAEINQLIQCRRSIFPATYIDGEIDRKIIEQILENANWAPTHRLTEPWRFKVFRGAALATLGENLKKTYQKYTPASDFNERKQQKMVKKTSQSACIIAICMQRDAKASVPEWEEIAATAAAVQNMWLTCTAYNIGCYWSSPTTIIAHADEFLPLDKGERCLGFFYMGYHNMPVVKGKRSPIGEKTTWVD